MKKMLIAALALLVAACSSNPDKLPPDNPFKNGPQKNPRELRAEASTLYKSAREALDSGDYSTAITRYDQIAARYPFTDYATQADLERVWALYRSYDPDKALSSADRFLREHPRHPNVDYVQYVKGLINFDRDEGLAGAIGPDTTKEDVANQRRSFDDFALLVQKYPSSRYAGDARARMIWLRNRLAQHEMHVVRFYVKRGAWIAAAKRAEQVVTQYPGAPVTLEAMQIMETSYRKVGLTQQADDAKKLLDAQIAVLPPSEKPRPGFFSRLWPFSA
ncbi:MAG TPA: outer membrane protein assembly factor BamD [Nevskiaceae bacterium]|nr:outer membrane protein assembly factor BamD [Nevskiaceae bacterium]